MEAFRAVARLRSFSAAAAELGVSQPSLSAVVRKLEVDLGILLFHRTTRWIELTEAGEILFDGAGRCLDDVAAILDELKGFSAQRSGIVRVAAPPLLASSFLPRVIAEFNRCMPGIRVELTDTGTEQIIDMVRCGHVSLGVGTFPENLSGLSATVVMRDEAMLFCHRDHPKSGLAQVSWAEIADDPHITLGPGSGLRALAERGFAQNGLSLDPVQQVNQITTVLGLVRQNVGIAVLPSYACALVDDQHVVSLRLVEPVVCRDIALLHSAGRRLPPVAMAFIDIIRRQISG